MEHSEFLFFPTLFHQQRESVLPAAQARFDEIAQHFPKSNILRLEYWAQVIEHHCLEDFEAVKRLAGQHIWREELLAERFEWGREHGIFAIAMRVLRLPMAIELPMIPEYGGCKSWIEIAHPVMPAGSSPVLDDEAFAQRLERFRAAICSVRLGG